MNGTLPPSMSYLWNSFLPIEVEVTCKEGTVSGTFALAVTEICEKAGCACPKLKTCSPLVNASGSEA